MHGPLVRLTFLCSLLEQLEYALDAIWRDGLTHVPHRQLYQSCLACNDYGSSGVFGAMLHCIADKVGDDLADTASVPLDLHVPGRRQLQNPVWVKSTHLLDQLLAKLGHIHPGSGDLNLRPELNASKIQKVLYDTVCP